ncbi:rhodopsin, GQ-coupled-like [Haliotis rubra]|uniref:rhodopsin, GQ-coupled-like n=1 Tax=Haliotis rubra TaxID=36100 RepID=UPI001EE585F7|nr:rhodopsin, GQ-coupled-like [Haliotis rubra]XP_046567840.1 rhodopsin, GQ-coupled-like [Haliotis rubra]XP_046567841.1 rhodopsin, GQ-coupled-like [Haliotis rubra]XP_046567842.1 rhodopsin, GQ-coupled-like [Haliotis rubra]XP_046567843.1 rhodopsin, GQ-coupled-like [Haliotis rubra]XP_046567844.1 rhodopsin, GQ-coupled-like [Haliotis rubra]
MVGDSLNVTPKTTVIPRGNGTSFPGLFDYETSTSFLTSANHSQLLHMVNDEIATTLIPAMVCIGVLMVSGFIGNTLVWYVFSTKLKHSTQNFLFVILAIFDLMSCCVAMPTEIADMRYYFTFDSVIACKILRFLVAFPTLASNIVLLIIAVDRYRKVCRPLHQQITRNISKKAVVLAAFVAILYSIPALFIYGRRSAVTRIPGVIGNDCSTSDAMTGKLYPMIYEITLSASFVIFTVTLLILYILIWREIKRHKQYMKRNANYNYAMVLLMARDRSADSSSSTPGTPRSRSQSHDMSNATTSQRPLSYRGQRTTVIAFLVTFVFILSFVPHLCLIISRTILKDFDHHLHGAKLVLYNLFIRSYFVNSVANPIIYGAMNYHFRRECVKAVKRFCFCTVKSK